MKLLQISILFVCFLFNLNDIVENAAFAEELHYGGDALTKMLLFWRIFEKTFSTNTVLGTQWQKKDAKIDEKNRRPYGTAIRCLKMKILTAVELDDLLLVDLLGQFSALWQADVLAFKSSFVEFQVVRKVMTAFHRFFDNFQAAASLAKTDNVAWSNNVGWDIDFLAIHRNVSMSNQLARACAGIREPEAVYQVVQTAFQQEHEVLTGDALHFRCTVEQGAELLLAQAVHVAKLLLLLQLNSVAAQFFAHSRTMLSWRISAVFQFFACAAQRNAKTAAQFELRTCVTCHMKVDSFSNEMLDNGSLCADSHPHADSDQLRYGVSAAARPAMEIREGDTTVLPLYI